ncbi:hypothetical protein BgAZ_501630 [Babesia gibsoni]|uniref:Uncharacterized protein n=1 Tax=Babesia gibsoni TaxID=33632 RepID=A0AAD8LMF8_BABGI|nr:hypothetical protein BgAZ_501630 [Babesia gibsoni]
MAEYCRFIEAAKDGRDLPLLSQMRKHLAHEKDSFGICIQALGQLLGLKLSELILYDHSFVMKDDVVSIYLSGGLPEAMLEPMAALESETAQKHTVALHFGKLLKERVQYGLDDVVESLDGKPAKDLYSRSIACLLRINMCALKAECKLRKQSSDVGGATIGCMLDETGTSLCELLSRCCLILCIFGAEDTNLFYNVKEVQNTLVRLVSLPLILHIIGAFAVVAFDSSCTFSLRSRRDFVESLATNLPDLLDRILQFNRIGMGNASELSVSRQSLTDSSEGGNISLNSTWSATHVRGSENGIMNLESSMGHIIDDEAAKSIMNISNSYWEYAFGNVPRFRTLSLLLDFILMFIKVASDGSVETHMLGWLDSLVRKPSFSQVFKPIFLSGDTTNFHKIIELSRILARDIFVTDLILGVTHRKAEALEMIKTAGPSIILSDNPNKLAILKFMLEGISEDSKAFIQAWYGFLKPLVVDEGHGSVYHNNMALLSSRSVTDRVVNILGGGLIDEVVPYAMMQNFGDKPHPDEDNVDALTARQLLVILLEIVGVKKLFGKLNRYVEGSYKLVNMKVTIETVQMFDFAVFCMWLLKMTDVTHRHKKILEFVKDINERTLDSTIHMYSLGNAGDDVVVRLGALEMLKQQIRADIFRGKVLQNEVWFDDKQLLECNKEVWDKYYADMGSSIMNQLSNAIVLGPTPQPTNKLKDSNQAKALSIDEYTKKIRLLLHIKDFFEAESLEDGVYVLIAAFMVQYNLPEEECTEILKMMITTCPVSLLYRIVDSRVFTVNVALMKAAMGSLHERFCGVVILMMTLNMQLEEPLENYVKGLSLLMDLVSKAVRLPSFLAELMGTEETLSILQNFIVFTNGLELTSHTFLESRCAMNLVLIESYLQYEVPHTPVPILQFVKSRMKRLMEVRAAKFNISKSSTSGLPQELVAAKGELNTLDLIITATFQVFFIKNPPPRPTRLKCWDRGDKDVLHWNLVGREYSIAFKTVTLLFKGFCQLGMTKLMFIAEHYIGVAAKINGDKHSTARSIMLSDNSMWKQDAIEYLYKVYLNIAKTSVNVGAQPMALKQEAP